MSSVLQESLYHLQIFCVTILNNVSITDTNQKDLWMLHGQAVIGNPVLFSAFLIIIMSAL